MPLRATRIKLAFSSGSVVFDASTIAISTPASTSSTFAASFSADGGNGRRPARVVLMTADEMPVTWEIR